jgi:pilus assembly protein CpaE
MVIANRFVKNSDISLKDGEKSISKRFLCAIPNDYDTTMRAINLGKPIRMMDNGSEISNKFVELASAISGKKGKKKPGLFFRS